MSAERNGFYTREEAEAYLEGSHNERLLGPILKQRQYLAQMWMAPLPCPNCLERLPLVDAIHVDREVFECTNCHAKVKHIVPLFGSGVGWEWALEPHQITAVAETK